MHYLEPIFQLLLAAALGGAIGFERESHGRAAGFRTHLLVSLGSCFFVLASVHFYQSYANLNPAVSPGVDPGRVAAQVVTGIGFLGAGAIIREKASVRGLTTAACLWVVSSIGVAVGSKIYLLSVVVTLLALISLTLLKKIEHLVQRDSYGTLRISCEYFEGAREVCENIIAQAGCRVTDCSAAHNLAKNQLHLEYNFLYCRGHRGRSLLEMISETPGMLMVELDNLPSANEHPRGHRADAIAEVDSIMS